MPTQNPDPYRAYNFKIVIGQNIEGHFTECSDLGVNVTAIKYREGGENQVVRHIPGPVDYAPVTQRYGLTSSKDLWEWLQKAVGGRVERKHVSIVMLNSEGNKPEMQWDLIDAWPSRWQGAHLDALNHEIAIESLTLVFDKLERR